MEEKILKIDVLTVLVIVLFFPYMMFAVWETDLGLALENKGYELESVIDQGLLFPSEDISFHILSGVLHEGTCRVPVEILYKGEVYGQTEMTLILRQTGKDSSENSVFVPGSSGESICIKRGSEILVVYESGGLKITTRGKALSDAVSGRVVRVSVPGFGSVVQAVAKDSGSAVVR